MSATEATFLQVSVLQAVAAVMWALGAWLVRADRLATAHWAVYAALSSATWLLLSRDIASPPLAAVVTGVLSALALRQGIGHFIGRLPGWRLAAVALAAVTVGGALAGDRPPTPSQVALNFGAVSLLYLAMARDLHRYARDELHWRWPLLLTLPVLLGGIGYGSRALRAVVTPESVLLEMRADSALNVGAALSFTVLVLLLHSMLMALVASRLVQGLHRLARRDSLTGLLNRRAMLDLIDQQVQRHRRAGDAFCVMMVDVDHFKRVNDRFGHATGDRALGHIAAVMTRALPAGDRVGRLGGEEFLVLLPATALAPALADAERLRLAVRQAPLDEGGLSVLLSVSVGVAAWRAPAEDTSALLVRADEALYRAKAGGRDRVESAEAGDGVSSRPAPFATR